MYAKYPALTLAVCSLCSSSAGAETNPLPQMVVTATRTAQQVDQALAAVTVISREDIERQQPLSVLDVLRGVPGVGISTNGGLGKNAAVFMRGTESDHVLVLIDGIRFNSATVGLTPFQDIPVDQIERIEIVRGPRSGLYGSEAIGGVIQIFTRQGGDKLTPSISAGGGSHGTYKVNAALSGSYEDAHFNLSAARLASDGFNTCSGTPFPPGDGCFTFEPDDDGYRSTSGQARFSYRFSSALKAEASVLHTEGRNQFDGTFVNQSEFVQQVVHGKILWQPASFWNLQLSGGRTQDKLDSLLNGDFMSRFDTERGQILLQNDFRLAKGHLLTLGFEYYDDSISSSEDFSKSSRDNKAGFAQYQAQWNNVDFSGGFRYDDNQQFGGQWTGNGAIGYNFPQHIRAWVAGGTAFKAPTFNDLYFPDSDFFFSDPTLDPESSWSVEIGISGVHYGIDWSFNAYYTEIDDLIGIKTIPSPVDPNNIAFATTNINAAEIYGLEATASTRLWDWDLSANLSLLRPENRSDDANKGNLLPRRAEQMWRLDGDRQFGRWRFGLSVYGEGRRFDDLANDRRMGGYVLVDARLSFELYKGLQLEGKVANLLNKDYETAERFNQDSTNLFFTVRYAPVD